MVDGDDRLVEFYGVDVREWPELYKLGMLERLPAREIDRIRRQRRAMKQKLNANDVWMETLQATGSLKKADKAKYQYIRAMLEANQTPDV